jgi:hypothetical protein
VLLYGKAMEADKSAVSITVFDFIIKPTVYRIYLQYVFVFEFT